MKIKKKHIFRFFGPFFSSFIIFGWDFVENEKNHQKSTVILLHFWLSKQKNYFWSHAKLAKMSSFQCTVARWKRTGLIVEVKTMWNYHLPPCQFPSLFCCQNWLLMRKSCLRGLRVCANTIFEKPSSSIHSGLFKIVEFMAWWIWVEVGKHQNCAADPSTSQEKSIFRKTDQ